MNAKQILQSVCAKQIANGAEIIVGIPAIDWPAVRANASKAIILARKHVGNGAAMESSARLCLSDAVTQHDAGNLDAAYMWAKKSLAYSVGIFHADYKRV